NACVCLDRYEEVEGYCATVSGKEKPFERPLANTDCKPPIIRL
ncbi:hypothetical protein A343_0179, partial [Porphyromonas gingivalis JCVI SC001]